MAKSLILKISVFYVTVCYFLSLSPGNVSATDSGQEVIMKMVYDLQKDIIEDKKELSQLRTTTERLQEENKLLKEKMQAFQKVEEKAGFQDVFNKTLARFRRQAQTSNKAGGVAYTRWGRTVCPSGAVLVYKGVAGSSWYDHTGGGSNYLCLPHDPQFGNFKLGFQSNSYMYGVEFEMYDNDPFSKDSVDQKITTFQDQTAVCAVCHVPNRSSHIMIPSKIDCPASWTKEYDGYLMSSHHTHKKADFVCVDNSPEVCEGGKGNQNGGLWYNVEASCGSLPCPEYADGKELTCVVCSK